MILFWSEVICLALTWWFGFVISYVAITQIPEYNDPMRMGYVPYTMAWCFISGFLASGCSFPHLMVFDTSSDTILYLQTLREMQEDEAERENEELAGAFGTTGYLGLLQDIASSAMRCAIPWVKMRQNEFAVLQWNVVFFEKHSSQKLLFDFLPPIVLIWNFDWSWKDVDFDSTLPSWQLWNCALKLQNVSWSCWFHPFSFAATNQGRIAVVVIQGPCTPCTCQKKLEYTKRAFGKGSFLQTRQFLDAFCTTSISKTHTHIYIYNILYMSNI